MTVSPSRDAPDAPITPDVGDQFLWNLLTSRKDLMLVTEDKLLWQAGTLQPRVLTPHDFVVQMTV